MDILQFIASVVGSLAWPCVAAFVLYLIRAQIGSLVGRITELTLPGGTKASFKTVLSEARLDAIKFQSQDIKLTEPDYLPKERSFENLITNSENTRPKISIMKSYERIENIMRKKIEELSLKDRSSFSDFIFYKLKYLDTEGHLYDMFSKIQVMNFQASASSDESIDSNSAIEYNDICEIFTANFILLFDKHKKNLS